MLIQFAERWNQYGIIADLAFKLKDISPQFGKTVLQKLVYILQEIYNVPCDYDYILYNYGPYCGELAEDLSFFSSMGGVKVEWNKSGGYRILPAVKTEHFRQRAKDFLDKYKNEISEVIKNFGWMTARDLELRSTIIFVYKESVRQNNMDKENITSRVKDIKPHFTQEEISSALEQLVQANIIHLMAST